MPHSYRYLQRPEEGIRFTPCLSYIQAVVSHETWVWERYSGPLEEQQVLVTSKLCLQATYLPLYVDARNQIQVLMLA